MSEEIGAPEKGEQRKRDPKGRFIRRYQQVTTEEDSNPEKNGRSQYKKDAWDKWNFIVTAGSTLVIALATIATVYVTIHHAKIFSEQLAEFKIQATASKDAAVAANISAEILNDTTKRQLRAYVMFDSGSLREESAGKYLASVTVLNSGQTPAYGVKYDWSVAPDDFPMDPERLDRVTPVPASKENNDIGALNRLPLGEDKIINITDDELSDIRKRKKAIYIRGTVEYRDAFQCKQFVRFIAVNIPADKSSNWLMRSYYSSVSDYRTVREPGWPKQEVNCESGRSKAAE